MADSKSAATTLFVCVTCRGQATDQATDSVQGDQPRPGARLLAAINAAPDARREGLFVEPVECLSNCNRSCTVAVTSPGKWTYVIGALDPDLHAGDVLSFAQAHRAHEAGLPAWRERPEHVRKNTISRVPPLPSRTPEEVSSR
jgi:predicted metal-binding protein